MRKLILIVLLLWPLGGCASVAENALQLPSGVLTQSIQNPVTRAHLYRLENGLIVGVSALQSYKRLCENGTIDVSCVGVVARLQGYVRQARPALRALRTFVRRNDQVNARVAFSTLQNIIAEFRGTAAAAGIQLPPPSGTL